MHDKKITDWHTEYKQFIQSMHDDTGLTDKYEKLEDLIIRGKETLIAQEKKMWDQGRIDKKALEHYQQLFRELETLYSSHTEDKRHHFYITIPVADRPLHLKQCLNSLLELCKLYQYGNTKDGHFDKIHVIIADDSEKKENIASIRRLTTEYRKLGLDTEYFGLEEQIQIINTLNTDQKSSLQSIIGKISATTTPENFSHKGASITRNIAYLRLNLINNSLPEQPKLFYFIDSDQQFCVNDAHGDIHYAINYFHYLNEIFSTQKTDIITGKVVGDPPVSPAVMASRFQDDVIGFITTLMELDANKPCQFHQKKHMNTNDAAYHDHAGLFGYNNSHHVYDYQCNIKGEHSNNDCLNHFCHKINGFFFGEHLTRETCFQYQGEFTSTLPARTIYTGNYIFRPLCLEYFISFATLKLRMAGPVLGRIIRQQLGDRFVSANLPMLHTRTVENSSQSEFRAGVSLVNNCVDLSAEFIRQYFGDIMLFTVEELCKNNFPESVQDSEVLTNTINKTDVMLLDHYSDKHLEIIDNAKHLSLLIDSIESSLPATGRNRKSLEQLRNFIKNILHNFDINSTAYRLIKSDTEKNLYLKKIEHAIINYPSSLRQWKTLLNRHFS